MPTRRPPQPRYVFLEGRGRKHERAVQFFSSAAVDESAARHMPPLTSMNEPVVKEASSTAAHRIARATSSACRRLHRYARLHPIDAIRLAAAGVDVGVGEARVTAFTRMPSPATSRASPL